MNKKRTICVIEGCERPSKAKDLCRLHYQRAWKRKRTPARSLKPKLGASDSKIEGVQTLVLALAEYERLYRIACGVPARVRWAAMVRETKASLETLRREIEDENAADTAE